MLASLTGRYLALHRRMRPVDSTFMGFTSEDHLLPPSSMGDLNEESDALASLLSELEAAPPPASAQERIGMAALSSALVHALRENAERPRTRNPAWYTGEAAFGVVSLLLRPPSPEVGEALRQRIDALPHYFASALPWLGAASPADWVTRARLEVKALARLLRLGLERHELGKAVPAAAREAAIVAAERFAAGLNPSPEADPAAGRPYLDFLFREVHGFPFAPYEGEALALEAFDRARTRLAAKARELSGGLTWREHLASLEAHHPTLEEVLPTYMRFHAQAMERADGAGLVTPASGYGLTFASLPSWAQEVVGDLYFLFYRSPAAQMPGAGSNYWVFPSGPDEDAYLRSQNYSTIKITHAVHHGSIGHHTQNARARASQLELGRVAGTDCASGIAILGGGSLIEGWACYVQDLLLEAEGFYSPQEELLLLHAELRNAAMCLADIRLHSGTWTLAEMRAFYQDEVGIPAARSWPETTRNSMWPSTRAMYWLGTRAIKEARREVGGDPRAFHDALLAYGSVPVHAVTDELRAGAITT